MLIFKESKRELSSTIMDYLPSLITMKLPTNNRAQKTLDNQLLQERLLLETEQNMVQEIIPL